MAPASVIGGFAVESHPAGSRGVNMRRVLSEANRHVRGRAHKCGCEGACGGVGGQ